jgi:serine/threonine protein kinase
MEREAEKQVYEKMEDCMENLENNYTPYKELIKKYNIVQNLSGRSGDMTFLVKNKGKKYILKIIADKKKLQICIHNLLRNQFDMFVPKMYDFGKVDSDNLLVKTNRFYYYYVQEFVNSPDFYVNYMNGVYRKYTVKEIKSILFQILLFFYYANEKLDFIHHDFKPENIVVNKNKIFNHIIEVNGKRYKVKSDRVYIIDFGTSEILDYKHGTFDSLASKYRHENHVKRYLKLIGKMKNIHQRNIKNIDLQIWHIVREMLEYQNKYMEVNDEFGCDTFEKCLTSSYFDDLLIK